MSQEALAEAVELFGTQDALAKKIGRTQQYVSKLLKGAKISAETAVAIDAATGGKIPRWKLRPDIFEKPKRRRVA